MASFWKKKIKSSYETSNNMGIDEEKINELLNNEREIKGKTMDNVLKKIEENKIKDSIRQAEAWKWYQENDIKKLRLDFGFKTQMSLSEEMGMHNSTLCRIESKNNKISPSNKDLVRLYDFFQNDFNKKIKKGNSKTLITNEKKFDDVVDFFKTFNLSKYLELNNLNKRELIEKLGYKGVGGSQYLKISELQENKITDGNNKLMIRLYNYIMKNNNTLNEISEKIDEIGENSMEKIPFAIAYESNPEVELHNENNYEIKSDYIIEKDFKPVKTIGLSEEQVIKDLQDKINKLERQVMLYEKLIEKL